jgi:hypothetical protein
MFGSSSNPGNKNRHLSRLQKLRKPNFHWPLGKRPTIIGGSCLGAAIIAAVVLTIIFVGGSSAETRPPVQHKVASVEKPKKPEFVPSNLTGLPVKPSINKLPVTAVMIENSLPARPQSGLNKAGVVFEAVAEAGITRFLALFQSGVNTKLGPVRSARPYFIKWELGFDAPYSHVGGSPEALRDIKSWRVKNIDQFYNAGYYHRIYQREAPHNMYTSLAKLNKLEKAKGFTTSKFDGFARLKKAAPDKKVTAGKIHINPSRYNYDDYYVYNKSKNVYKRYEGGKPHYELAGAGTGKKRQITPKVVIAIVMRYSLERDHYHSRYNVIGSGKAYVFQNGGVTVGHWQKTSSRSQITFTGASGQPIKLDPGQTWITAIKSASGVSYKP